MLSAFPGSLTLSQTANFSSTKLKAFADNNFEFDENGRQSTEWLENTVGKGEIARYEQFLLFLQCFQKTCTADMLKPGLVWESLKEEICNVKDQRKSRKNTNRFTGTSNITEIV